MSSRGTCSMRLKSYDNRPITPNPRRGWAWAQRLQAQQAHQRFQRAFESSDMTQWRRAAAFAGNRHKHRSWQASSRPQFSIKPSLALSNPEILARCCEVASWPSRSQKPRPLFSTPPPCLSEGGCRALRVQLTRLRPGKATMIAGCGIGRTGLKETSRV